MKVNIIVRRESSILNDWENISDRIDLENVKKVKSIKNLDEYYDDGELEELRLNQVIESLKDDELESAMSNWMNKVGIGGVITITSLDILEVAHMLTSGSISVLQASSIIYSEKQNCFCREQIEAYLRQNGFAIERITLDNLQFSIKGRKNAVSN